MFTIDEILELAIQLEKNGEAVYRDALSRVDDSDLAFALGWLADDEARHIETFSRMKAGLTADERRRRPASSDQAFLQQMVAGQTFSLGEADIPRLETVASLLELALEFERDTVVFYEMLGTFVQDPGAQGVLRRVLQEEEHHVKVLETYLKEGRVPQREENDST
ncbi:MAG: ferritin family protein [Desulfobacteraceae bacterium]|jgi:rubrerythrin